MRNIGEIISTNRKKMKLSQQQLVTHLEKEGFQLTVKAISKWETNATEPSISAFMALCKILNITNIYEAYFGENPADPLSTLNAAGKAKALDYIDLLHASGKYECQTCTVIDFCRYIELYKTPVSAGTGNFLEDGNSETLHVPSTLLPEAANYGVMISGDSMEPEFEDGQIAWVQKQESLENGEIGIFSLNGESYLKKLSEDQNGIFLVSLNKKYPPIPVGENDRLDVFGKVVGKGSLAEISSTK